MSEASTLFEEASAFFTLFAHSPWKSAHVRTRSLEIFVSRERDMPNPAAVMVQAVAEPAVAETLRAPHLGTLVELAGIGTRLAAGATYARLELLGEMIDLAAESEGSVVEHLHPIGTLVEFDQPLLGLS